MEKKESMTPEVAERIGAILKPLDLSKVVEGKGEGARWIGRPTEEEGKLTVGIGMCVYRDITPWTYGCQQRDIVQSGPPIRFQVRNLSNDAAIDRSRSRLVQMVLYQPDEMGQLDVLVTIDSDISWPAGAVEYMAMRAHEEQAIIGAIVSKRATGEGCAAKYTPAVDAAFKAKEFQFVFNSDVLIPAVYVGAAFTAYPVPILRDIHDRAQMPVYRLDGSIETMTIPMVIQGFKPYFLPAIFENEGMPGSFDYASEDWALCGYASRLGHKIFATTKPWIHHYGPYGYTPEDAWLKDKKEDKNSGEKKL